MSRALTQELSYLITAKDQASRVFGNIKSEGEKAFGQSSGLAKIGSVAKVGMLGLASGVGAVSVGLGFAVDTAAEFQQTMANVKAVTGTTGKDFEKLEKLARKMGETTQFSASESATAMEFLGMAGFSTTQIMEGLPATLQLAAAGSMDLGRAADISSNILSGMNLEISELSHVADGLATVATASNSTIEMMGEGFKYVASTATLAGVEFDETAAALGILASSGMQASMGGTSLNAAFTQMLKPTDEAAKVMKKAGLEFTDAEGKLHPLVDIVGDLEEANLSAAEMIELFGDRGTRAMGNLVNRGSEDLRQFTNAVNKSGGVSENIARTKMSTFEGSMKTLSSAVESVQISLGSELLPILTDFVNDGIVPVVRETSAWIDKMGGIPQMLSNVGTLITAFGESAWAELDNIFGNADYRATFVENIGGVFGAGLELGSNFVVNLGALLANTATLAFEPLRIAGVAVWEVVKSTAQESFNAIGSTATGVVNGLITKFNEVGSAIGVTFDTIDFTPITVDAPQAFETHWGTLKNNMVSMAGEVTGSWNTLTEGVQKDVTENLVPAVTKAFGDSAFATNEGFQKALSAFKSTTQDAVDDAGQKGTEAGKLLGQNTADAAEGELSKPENRKKFTPEPGSIAEDFEGAFQTGLGRLIRTGDFGSALSAFGNNLLDGIIGGMTSNIASGFTSMLFGGGGSGGGGGSLLGGLFDGFGNDSGNSFLSGFKNPLKGFFGGSGAGSMIQQITSIAPQAALLGIGLKVFGPPIVQGIGQAIEGTIGKVVSGIVGDGGLGGGGGELFTQGTVQFSKQLHKDVAIGLAQEGFNAGDYVTATTVKGIADNLGISFQDAIGSSDFLSAGEGGFNRAYNDNPTSPRSREEALAYLGYDPEKTENSIIGGGVNGTNKRSALNPNVDPTKFAFADEPDNRSIRAPLETNKGRNLDHIVINIGSMMTSIKQQLLGHIKGLDQPIDMDAFRSISNWLNEGGEGFGHLAQRYFENDYDFDKTVTEGKRFVATYLKIPSFHTGLPGREYPAILERGEGVLNRRAMDIIGQLNNGALNGLRGDGGFVGGSGNINVFYTNIHTPDVEGAERLIKGRFMDMVVNELRDRSSRGDTIVYDAGVESLPTV